MTEVEFLPAWYLRRARLRGRLIIASCATGIVLLVAGVVLLLN